MNLLSEQAQFYKQIQSDILKQNIAQLTIR